MKISKGLKIFVNIIYYIFMFIMGVLLSMYLPFARFYDVAVEKIQENINSGNLEEAIKYEMGLIGGYFNSEYIYKVEKDDHSGLILFEAATLFEEDTKIQKSYIGFLYGIQKDYITVKESANSTKLKVNGSFYSNLLDYDSNNDGTNDSNLTGMDYGFIFIDLHFASKTEISSIEFIDCDNKSFWLIESIPELNFNSSFFNALDPFIREYNSNKTVEVLDELALNIKNTNEHYLINPTLSDVQQIANKKSIPVIIIYFVIVYILGDISIGFRFINKLVVKIWNKIFKKKKETKETVEVENSDVFGHDYLCQVIINLDVSEVKDFDTPVTLTYSNQTDVCEFNFTKAGKYSCSKKIKAGDYVNPFIEINSNYQVEDLPLKLNAFGYSKIIVIKIIKKKEDV